MADNDRKPVFLHAYLGFRGNHLAARRCAGKSLDSPTLLDCILLAGHAGVSFGRFGPIYGFLPEIGPLETIHVIAALKRGDAFPGRVGDDTEIFVEAASEGATIVTVEFSYPADSVEAIQKQIDEARQATQLRYSFPRGRGDYNCITWLGSLGLDLPDETGQMIDFVTELEPLKDAEPIEVD